jgi:RNA polymerase sigma factor (sigma-70 family)
MDAQLGWKGGMTEHDRRVADAYAREGERLRGFIRRRVAAADDADDILQDVFSELVEATRLPAPIEHVGAWLFQVARHRIADWFRRRGVRGAEAAPRPLEDADAEGPALEDLLPSPDSGPEAAYMRRVFLEELDDALAELPAAQRDVFLAHELDGRSFKDLAAERGVPVNTLLSQKHYAVRHLRRRLQAMRAEFNDIDNPEGS